MSNNINVASISTPMNDGKYTLAHPDQPFPEYVLSKEHPFTICESLSHTIGGVITTKFSGNDSPERFAKNLEIMPANWHYRTKSVEYKVNASGYRTREWKDTDWRRSIVLLGCSNTFGVGLAEDETISAHLEQLSRHPVINLGFPGGSNELILNNCSSLVNQFGAPYAVAINWTSIDRIRYYTQESTIELGSWNHGTLNTGIERPHALWVQSVLDETNLLTKNFYIAKATNSIFLNRSKYVTVSSFINSAHYMRADKGFQPDDTNKARDVGHPGPRDAQKIAHFINEKIR